MSCLDYLLTLTQPPPTVPTQAASDQLGCGWCGQPITDPKVAQSLVAQGTRTRHAYCSFECGQELALRNGSSSLIRRQLFDLVGP